MDADWKSWPRERPKAAGWYFFLSDSAAFVGREPQIVRITGREDDGPNGHWLPHAITVASVLPSPAAPQDGEADKARDDGLKAVDALRVELRRADAAGQIGGMAFVTNPMALLDRISAALLAAHRAGRQP